MKAADVSESEAKTAKDFFHIRGQMQPKATIIAVGGGKGGVGKSFLSSSLAIFLAHMGHDTVAVDLDLGAANLHTSLGQGHQSVGVNEFLKDQKLTFDEIAHQTSFPNLRLISGCTEAFDIANIDSEQRSRLMSSIFHMQAKFIILDLSAGTQDTTLDFFLMANHKIITVTPEPSSVENAYRFMKAAFYRRIKRYEYQMHLQNLVSDIMTQRVSLGVRAPADLLRVVSQKDPVNGARLAKLMERLEFEILLNQVRSMKDMELGPAIKSVTQKYFGIDAQYLGHLEHDNAVWQSLRKRKHLLIEYPHSRLYTQLMAITRRLANPNSKRAVV